MRRRQYRLAQLPYASEEEPPLSSGCSDPVQGERAGVRIRTRTAWSVKRGNTPEEFEDAAWPEDPVDAEVPEFSCAVADGATETSFSGLWAGLLARAWRTGDLTPRSLASDLPALQREWKRAVGSKPLPWYAEEKVGAGAFSSLLGFTIRQTRHGASWSALAVGDSCLYLVRRDRLRVAFPMTRSDEFTNRPQLLSTNPAANGRLTETVRRRSGRCRPGDVFFLMTDALGAWFLRAVEGGEKPWLDLVAQIDDAGSSCFARWVDCLRDARSLRNDDVTAIAVAVPWGPPPLSADAVANSSGL